MSVPCRKDLGSCDLNVEHEGPCSHERDRKERTCLMAEREEALELLKASYLSKTAPEPMSTRSWHDRTRSLLKRCGFL